MKSGYYVKKDQSSSRHNIIARLHRDARPIGSFASGGVKTDFDIPGSTSDQINGVAVQNDGKAIVVGTAKIGNKNYAFVARFNSDGNLDTSFAGSGYRLLDWGGNDSANAVAITPAFNAGPERIRIVGRSIVAKQTRAVYQTLFVSNGANVNHPVIISPAPGDEVEGFEFNAIATNNPTDIKPNAISYAAGIKMLTNNQQDFFIARFLASGALDTTFGAEGLVSINFSGLDATGTGVTIQPDGKPVIAGYLTHPRGVHKRPTVFALAKINS